MNEEIHCITTKGKAAMNGWENGDSWLSSSFIQYMYIYIYIYIYIYEELGQFFFHTYTLVNLFKER